MDAPQEIKTVREVPRQPEHCDRPMRRMSFVSSLGKVKNVWVCAKECGYQATDNLKEESK